MSDNPTKASEKKRPTAARSRGKMFNAMSTIAFVVAIVSLILNIYLAGLVQAPESRIDSLESENSALESQVDSLSARILILEMAVAGLGPGTGDLENLTAQLQSRISDLEGTVDDLEQMISYLESVIATLESRVSDLENGTGNGGPEPNVALANADAVGPNTWEVEIAGVSESTPLGSWKAVLSRGVIIDSVLDPLDGWTSGNITFVDLAAEGSLTCGDYFMITTSPGIEYKLSIIWKASGNARGSETWNT